MLFFIQILVYLNNYIHFIYLLYSVEFFVMELIFALQIRCRKVCLGESMAHATYICFSFGLFK